MNKLEQVANTIIKFPHLDVNQLARELDGKVPVATVLNHNQHARVFLRMMHKNGLKICNSKGEDFFEKMHVGPHQKHE